MGTADPLYDEIPDRSHRFIYFVGEGFLLGGACGSAFYFARGLCSSPVGGRLAGAAHAVRVNAPRAGGFFAAYSALFCALETAMALARRRDDLWNSIAAGAASLGLLHRRLGGRNAAVSALFGAAVVVVFEGADWVAGEWDSRFASNSHPPARTNLGLLAPATTAKDSPVSRNVLSWLTSTISPSSVSATKDLQLLDLSRKLLLQKMRKGFYSPVLEDRFSVTVSPWWESKLLPEKMRKGFHSPTVEYRFSVSPWWESYLIK